MSAWNRSDVANLLQRTADAVRAGEVPVPHVGIQFIITGVADQDRALLAAASLYPGMAWEGKLTEHRSLPPAAHIGGRTGPVHVTISGTADKLLAATVCSLTDQDESGAAA